MSLDKFVGRHLEIRLPRESRAAGCSVKRATDAYLHLLGPRRSRPPGEPPPQYASGAERKARIV
jgi:hypothetical protein